MNIDNIFGIHQSAIMLREKRGQIIANNLANQDTPNYKARDFDVTSSIISSKNSGTSRAELYRDIDLKFRKIAYPRADGNTVDPQVEKLEYSQNAMQIMSSITFLNKKYNSILNAIKGGK